jgi:restriction endonuclease Mrr
MQLSPFYLEKIAAAEQVGEQRMVLRFLEQRFNTLPTDLLTRIESLSPTQLQAMADSVLSLSSISELSTWLDNSKISDS